MPPTLPSLVNLLLLPPSAGSLLVEGTQQGRRDHAVHHQVVLLYRAIQPLAHVQVVLIQPVSSEHAVVVAVRLADDVLQPSTEYSDHAGHVGVELLVHSVLRRVPSSTPEVGAHVQLVTAHVGGAGGTAL